MAFEMEAATQERRRRASLRGRPMDDTFHNSQLDETTSSHEDPPPDASLEPCAHPHVAIATPPASHPLSRTIAIAAGTESETITPVAKVEARILASVPTEQPSVIDSSDLGPTASSVPGTLVSLVIPAMNEEANIGWVLERIPPCVDEVILVDGNSRDGTVVTARAVRPDVVVIQQSSQGKGAALRTGFALARGQIIVMIDADGSMDPVEIPRYLGLLSSGFDFVKGSRFSCGAGSSDITFSRRMGNSALRSMVNLMYRARFSDLCYGFCAFTREALEAMNLDANGFEIETQIAVRALVAKLRIGEVPSMESDRLSGESNLRAFRDGMRILRVLFKELKGFGGQGAVSPALVAPSPLHELELSLHSEDLVLAEGDRVS